MQDAFLAETVLHMRRQIVHEWDELDGKAHANYCKAAERMLVFPWLLAIHHYLTSLSAMASW
jgi:hypothetical protein